MRWEFSLHKGPKDCSGQHSSTTGSTAPGPPRDGATGVGAPKASLVYGSSGDWGPWVAGGRKGIPPLFSTISQRVVDERREKKQKKQASLDQFGELLSELTDARHRPPPAPPPPAAPSHTPMERHLWLR